MSSAESTPNSTPYRVLARKYRPRHFDELIGQDALVRTLSNAINSGRIAHAFMLTGVRGVGKTTTARIIAKSGPTTGPTDDCAICKAIAEDRHPDVMEMDAASRTGVDDIREILDGVRYAPVSARYKIYIIDEVHMLSKQAFNALLKTLEEPPSHVKFIFATTEIRKVPVTVLSRCQRFDLRRVDVGVLAPYFSTICVKENVEAETAAIETIARAADGSVRDGLSLLDQAIALGQGKVLADDVGRMLGLADRSLTLSLFAAAMQGHSSESLTIMDRQYQAGADLLVVMQDLLDITHDLTTLKILECRDEAFKNTSLPVSDIDKCKQLARDLPMPALQRAWTLLLKGLQEVQTAPDARAAAQMAIMRLIYAADLPDPARLIRDIQAGNVQTNAQPIGGSSERPGSNPSLHAPMAHDDRTPMLMSVGGGALTVARAAPVIHEDAVAQPQSFEDIIALCEDKGEMLLASQLVNYAHLVKFEIGRVELRMAPEAPANAATRLSGFMRDWTGNLWMFPLSKDEGQATLSQKKSDARTAERKSVLESPNVQAVTATFPGAELHRIVKDEAR